MMNEVVWSTRAQRAYGRILDYIRDEFGTTRAKQYIAQVYREVNKLPTNPKIGQLEPWLDGSRYEFRRIIIGGLTKIIYKEANGRIEIADVWDTRQDPETLAARIAE
ncbi:MAG: type II toxin-antitoxin system RelE/ParE family toxin [Paludibacteraceae bacterium]|nr:type II toxin-antitoxin system RelE/ParE family toxin [Paludibacteraceae bacterium]